MLSFPTLLALIAIGLIAIGSEPLVDNSTPRVDVRKYLRALMPLHYGQADRSADEMGEEPPPSIRMSAIATASSFGVLALSHIPVVSSLGSTVAVIVLAALAITELSPLASQATKAHDGLP